MANIVILGGTKFFGILLVDKLLKDSHNITVISRAKELPPLLKGRGIQHICIDIEALAGESSHSRIERLKQMFSSLVIDIDVVVDNISWQSQSVTGVVHALYEARKIIQQYILCSSVAVYNNWNIGHGKSNGLKEGDIDLQAEGYLPEVDCPTFSGFYHIYANGKRLAEIELIASAKEFDFSYTIMRPVVIEGVNDPHMRTWYWAQRLLDGGQILIPDTVPETLYRHVCVEDVAEAFYLAVINRTAFNKIYNVAGEEIFSVEEYLGRMAKALGLVDPSNRLVSVEPGNVREQIPDFEFPPFFSGFALSSDIAQAKRDLNYKPTPFDQWMGGLAQFILTVRSTLPDSLGYQSRREEESFKMRGVIYRR